MKIRSNRLVALLAAILFLGGCTSTSRDTIIRDEFIGVVDARIVEVLLDNGETIRFDEAGGRYIERALGRGDSSKIVGRTWDHRPVEVLLSSVLDARIETTHIDSLQTVLFIFLGIPVILLAILLALVFL